ncbi:LSM domain protein [Cordyceps militaris CM01]|uniref:LSM domain protein n=2 Tax=Cordyceps militaris TaxID=73501 RepID=G3JJX5_CORMM|nr:LSM domain protein [Cordyceps militaris CM01]ATY58707.1 LSM domain [Cordyceps militaris]ATY58773.1 LSM domain [Cordyceps militaris]EGX91312.1 LSM domain protein [Cordyceps militaris CM01]
MDKDAANEFLSSLLNQNLAVTATDGRLFWGQFKCTDAESNIVLAQTYEYRPPSEEMRAQAATQAMGAASVTLDMTSRYLGLVVVPGHRITKVEVERFASQVRQQKGQAVI